MKDMYEASPGLWLMDEVSLEEHTHAVAGNYNPHNEVEEFSQELDDQEIWITKYAKLIAYRELTDTHLHNIVNMLGDSIQFFPMLKKEAKNRLPTTYV